MQSEIVVINAAIIASGQGISFAIPINLAKGIIEQIETSGEVSRDWMGVAIQLLTGELADYYGLKDEKAMISKFGDAYRLYMQSVPMFFPKLKHLRLYLGQANT